MISADQVRTLALSYAETTESPHFEKTSFRVRKKIFATMDSRKKKVVVKLSDADQDVYCSGSKGAIYPVEGAWGQKGWTLMKLDLVDNKLFEAVMTSAYVKVTPKKL